ncbi:AI-2E family transporter [Nitrospira sp.]|nr:AI-2E family transporter [Nitrospira sp.]
MPDRQPLDRHIWEIAAARDILWLVGIALLCWMAYVLRSILIPIFVGFGVAYLFNPLITTLERRWHIPRLVTICAIVLVLFLVLVAALIWLGPTFSEQFMTLAEKLPQYLTTLASRYDVKVSSLTSQLTDLTDSIKEDPLNILGPLFSGTGRAFGILGAIIGSTLNVTLMIVLVPIFFILFAWDFQRIESHTLALIPPRHRPRTERILHRIDLTVSGFFRGRLLVGLITAALYSFGWALSDVPYWFLLGIMTGVLTIIPYASAIGWPLAVLLKYVDVLASQDSGAGWLAIVIWPSATYLIVQFIESWILTPWVQSQSLDLSATTVLIVVLIGGAIGGFFGLLLAIPIAACVKILAQEYLTSYGTASNP